MAIEYGLTCDARWNLPVRDLASAGKGAGFTSLGIAAEVLNPDSLKELRASGLRCHEVMALIVSNNERATLESAERLAEKAAAVEADWVVTVFTATMNDQSLLRVERCASILAEAGTRMAVEFSPLGSVQSIPEALAIVDRVGATAAGVLIDTWHFFHGPSSWTDLAEIPLERIAYVQFADAPAPTSNDQMHETMNRRAMPGTGIHDLDRFSSVLRSRGWGGLVSVEVLSHELGGKPVREFARVAHETTIRYWS